MALLLRRKHHLLLTSGGSYQSVVLGLAPVAWYRLRETSGTNAANSGSGGSGLDMTIAGTTTLGQTGQLGANEAFLLDGATSRLQTPNNAAIASLTAWEWAFLVRPTSLGESNAGRLYTWGNNVNEGFAGPTGGTNVLRVDVYNTTPTQFQTATTTGVSLSAWQWLFIAYDNATDRKVHIYKGISGAVAEYAYSVQPAMTGTYGAPTSALNLFNKSDQSATYAGLGDEVLIFNRTLTAAERLSLVTISGA